MMKTPTLTSVAACVLVGLLASPGRAAEPAAKEFAADKGPDTVDVSGYTKDIQESYAVFASKCSKCHTLARPINTNLAAAEWKMYVKRMMNKPDSGISPDQGKAVYTFLKFWQDEKDKQAAKKAP